MKNLTEQPAWLALCQHYQEISTKHMRDWFADDTHRFDRYSIKHGEFLLDYSRNRIDDTTMRLLFDLAESVELKSKIVGLFAGHTVNTSEQRPALHTALRDHSGLSLYINNENISVNIVESRAKLFQFAEDVHSGKRGGSCGKPFKHIVNIGIGDLILAP